LSLSRISAVSRDGIPFELISQAVPIIEKEVNTILSQIVEFGVNIQTDGKNVVTNIVYSDKSWPLELASGLEKFLTSLVIRVALINISNLPRPNFIAIDEGFGCADADNLSSMNSLFSILKSSFDFMLIISHLDSMKDMVDHTIEIKKENGFSKITV
jgi:DNA repair exonuclease SbcCD ATPase subunit